MNSNLFVALSAGIGAMLGWGFSDFIAKKTIDKIGSLSTIFWVELFGLIPLLILSIITPKINYLPTIAPSYLLLLGILSASSYLLLYSSFQKGKISILSPIFASYSGVVILLSIIIYGESISYLKSVVLVIMLLGTVSMCIENNIHDFLSNLRFTNGLLEVILAVILFSTWTLLWSRFVSEHDWLPALLIVRAISTTTIIFFSLVTKNFIKMPNFYILCTLIMIGSFDVLAFGLISYGFNGSSLVSIVTLLSSAFSLPTLVLAHFLLKEKITNVQFAGIAVLIAGTMSLTFV